MREMIARNGKKVLQPAGEATFLPIMEKNEQRMELVELFKEMDEAINELEEFVFGL